MFSTLYEKSLVVDKAFRDESTEAFSAPLFTHCPPPVILSNHAKHHIGPLMGWVVWGPMGFSHPAPFV